VNEIYFDGVKKEAPARWVELTEEQLLVWVKICAKTIEPAQALMFVSSVFYSIRRELFFKLNVAQQIQLADTLKFLLENDLHAWLIPDIKVGLLKKLSGPSDHLSSSTIAEFRSSESYYHAYHAQKDERYLDQLIATLYRPTSILSYYRYKNNGKDERKLFSEVDVIRQAPKMSQLDKDLRAAILFNYEGCRSFIVKRYPTIFVKGDGEQPSKVLPDLNPYIKTIAGGKFGPYKDTEQTDLYLFLDHLRDEIEALSKQK
jgi:hypothetical protein